MAALEKIRKRAVLLTVVIGVALLAFILGDAEKMVGTMFGNGNTIAKVDGDKIDAVEFQKRYEQASQQLQNQGQTADAALIQQRVIEQMISERLLEKELQKVGIDVSNEEITEAMTGKNANMMVMQFAQQMGVESPAQLYDLLYNPTKYGANEQQVAEAKAQWETLQTEVIKNLRYAKLQTLIAGSIQANKLDRKQINEENEVTNTILYVKQAYDALTGDQYKPTDAELKAQYDKDKYLYKLNEEVRKLHYVAVDVVPSKTDLNRAAAMIGETLDSLQLADGVDRVRNNSELIINEGIVRLSDIRDTEVKDFVAAATVGQVSEPKFTNSTYTYSIVKLIKKELAIDSINVDVISVQGAKSVQDSVLNLLNGGATLADVKKVKGVDGQENQWQVIINVADSVKTRLTNAPAGFFRLDGNDQAAFLCRVNEKKAPKTMYTIAQIEHKVYPSTETTDGLRNKLQDFIMANNTAAAFEANAVKAGYQPVEASVTPSTPQIDGIDNTRKTIQWLFEAKKGDVSPIYDKDNKDKMIVVALDAIYDNGYAPLDDAQVKAAITAKATNEKKAEALMKDLQGKKSLAEYATAMKATTDTTQVTFGQQFIPKIGVGEAELTAKASVAKKGELVGPVKGVYGVYAFQVSDSQKSERKPTDFEADRTFATTRGSQAVMQNALEILRKAVKVEKDMIRFF
ncbi:MAG: SurA N-terminal domain-containing protein [Muribaculaceae bacterium]